MVPRSGAGGPARPSPRSAGLPRRLLLLAAFLLPPALAGAQPVLLGEINPRSGILAAQGLAVAQGIQLAVERQNGLGGIAGRPVRLLSRDDEGRPDRAVAAAEELTARYQVAALVGGYVDSLVGPVSEVAERTRTPYLATASLDERLSRRGYQYFFRVSTLRPYVEVTLGLLRDLLRPRRVALLYSTTPGATQLAARQREGLSAMGVAVPVFEAFAPGLADFTPLLLRVRDAGADVLVSDAFFADHLLLVRQMAQAGVRVGAFLGTFGLEFPAVIAELGPAAEGLLGTTTWQPGVFVPAALDESQAFVETYRSRFGRDPVPLAMHGYAAARALLAALEAAGPGARGPALRDALARVDLLTPLGRVRFDATGEPLHYQRVVVQIQQGRHVVVYPLAVATAPLLGPRP